MPVSLPTETYSVSGFCQAAAALLDSPDTADFVRFVLTGVHDGHQAVIDPILNRVRSTETSTLQLRRDYDSVLGISKDICVRSTELTIYPLAKYQDSLKNNVHIEYEFENDLVCISSRSLTLSPLQIVYSGPPQGTNSQDS